MGIRDKYLGIVSIIDSEWKNGKTDISESTLKLIRFTEIRKENIKNREQVSITS